MADQKIREPTIKAEECEKERIQFYPSSISGFMNLPQLADGNRTGVNNFLKGLDELAGERPPTRCHTA